jgi:transcriptional regulator with XRE-family HTH domain
MPSKNPKRNFSKRGIIMFNSVEFVRKLCKQRGIAISQLEKDCGFSNGYLNPKKMTKLPYDRAVCVAKYLHVTAQEVLTGEPAKVAEAGDILDQVDVAFYGEYKELDPEQQETVRDMVRLMRQRKMNRK